MTAWTGVSKLPHPDQELDRDPLPAPVAALRELLAGAGRGRHVHPGVRRRACRGRTERAGPDRGQHCGGKPVAWITVAADARRCAHDELATVLGDVQARVLAGARTHVPLDRTAVGDDEPPLDAATVGAVRGVIVAVLAAVGAAEAGSR